MDIWVSLLLGLMNNDVNICVQVRVHRSELFCQGLDLLECWVVDEEDMRNYRYIRESLLQEPVAR